ncbi:Armadillo/beta-catenin-like repeat protein, partial [Opisthorchis viverrini]
VVEFEQYQKARLQFVQTVADLSLQKQNIETLQNAGVMSLLRPLLLDTVPTIQQTAAIALGRLANQRMDLAEAIVREDILPQLVYSLAEQNRFYKRAATFVLRSIAKHSPELAQKVVDSGALDALIIGLEEFDPVVKEGSAATIANLAKHSTELAQTVVDVGAIPLLVLCVQEPEISLKRMALAALSDIAKHSAELAQTIADTGAIAHIAQLLLQPDTLLKVGYFDEFSLINFCSYSQRQVLAVLSNIAKHSVDLAELVVEAEIFPTILVSLKDADEIVRKNCSTLIKDIVKHTSELSQLVTNAGGAASIVEFLSNNSGYVILPGVMALGYIAAHSESLAMAIIMCGSVPQLKCTLWRETNEDVKAACAWALGQIGRHTPEHAKAVAKSDVLPIILECFIEPGAPEELKSKSKKALKQIIQKCVDLDAIEPLLTRAPGSILKYAVAQFAKVLPHDPNARRNFVSSGALKKIQELKPDDKETLAEYITAINNCFPEEVVRYYSPGYVETLIERVDQYRIPV